MFLYLSVFASLIIFALLYSKIAKAYHIVDIPNERSSHTFPVIRGGGILFFFAALIFFMYSKFEYPGFFLGLSILAILSFTDDIMTLKARLRLPFQFLAIFFILQTLNVFTLPVWTLILISIVAVGFINIYNFMDGINGITGLYSLAVFHGFWILNKYLTLAVHKELIIFTTFSLLIFGFFNFRKKAKFFAGDVGSVSVAAIILFIGIKFLISTNSPLIFGLVLVYGIDAGLTIIRRILKKENIFKPHRQHLYQHLVDKKRMSHMTVSLAYALTQLGFNFIIFWGLSLDLPYQYSLLFLLIISTGLGYFFLLNWSKKINNTSLSLK